ncbi:cache domain-containing protein [Piscinibacter sp.]|jgi:two-component system NarL family sensor kinase|uniref:cache domain-containing protein n=1 Tax=Piscinibacter sp. TaxID=1903157 RepID=UPI001B601677|nr:cache domain-containing protein [Piscinibacter sp.]MBK7531731.1 cache domain-containing protein [Piscinibacter sp.]MBP6544892.1 cache domain-containing protein [Piscinibacter sp.]
MRPRSKFLLLAILPLLVSLGLIALAMRQQQQDLSRRERQVVETAYMAAKQTELLNHVGLARSLLAPLYDTRRDDAQTLAEALRLLSTMDYGIDGYFFVFDTGGRNLLHPRQPELQNQDLWDLKDAQGVPLIRELIARAHEGGGFVQYLWQKPSTRTLTPKLAYAISLPRWNMVIGTGLYLDDIQGTLTQIDRQVDENVASTMLWIAGIALFGVVLIGGSGMVLNFSEAKVADAKLRNLARQVVKSQEDERAHLSRELHDSTSQTLVSIKLLLESAATQLGREATPPALQRAVQRLGDALHEVRRISHRLRPAELDTLGLPAALDDLAEEFNQHGRVRIALRLWGQADTLPDEVNTVLFRVVQESLTNIEKHSKATRVQARLIFHAGGLRLRIVDDGIGFDVPAIRVDPRRGIGMRNMRERVESIGGEFSIESRPGRTAVLADLTAAAIERLRPAAKKAA